MDQRRLQYLFGLLPGSVIANVASDCGINVLEGNPSKPYNPVLFVTAVASNKSDVQSLTGSKEFVMSYLAKSSHISMYWIVLA